MNGDLTVASWFSGAGGLDLGLERARWAVASHSEIDEYASAVLRSRWSGVPNLGCIRAVNGTPPHDHDGYKCLIGDPADVAHGHGLGRGNGRVHSAHRGGAAGDWTDATLWAGGPPCQDFSVAGKRKGLAGERSSLALVWFDLVERYRPPAILFENVPGLFSSHAGRDLAALCGRLAELGYVGAVRTLDARFFGVPQRRRRVFILALHARTGLGPDSPGAVLSVGSRCGGHPAAGGEAGPGAADGARPGVDFARAVTASSGKRHDDDTDTLIPQLHPTLRSGGHGAPGIGRDGDEGRLVVAPTLRVGPQRPQDGGPGDTVPIVAISGGEQSYHQRDRIYADLAPALDAYGDTPSDAPMVGLASGVRRLTPVECERLQGWPDGWTIPNEWRGKTYDGSDLLPEGLDSHRYRCIGNGVAAPVATWIGRRLAAAIRGAREDAA